MKDLFDKQSQVVGSDVVVPDTANAIIFLSSGSWVLSLQQRQHPIFFGPDVKQD